MRDFSLFSLAALLAFFPAAFSGQKGMVPAAAMEPPLEVRDVVIDEQNSQVIVTVVNTSPKRINAYQLSARAWFSDRLSKAWSFGGDMAGVVGPDPRSASASDRIEPGEPKTVTTHLRRDHDGGVPANVEVEVSDAVFQDATGYGSPEFLKEILANRRAKLQELSYWLKVLGKLKAAPAAEIEPLHSRLSRLRSPATRVLSKPARSSAYAVTQGISGNVAMMWSQALREGPEAILPGLTFYIAHLEKRKASLESSLPLRK